MMRPITAIGFCVLIILVPFGIAGARPAVRVDLYGVHELSFAGPRCGPADTPAVDVDLYTTWRHESGSAVYRIGGFWDGDGKGGATGNVFKVRFCPTRVGTWQLVQTTSNDASLRGRHEGYTIRCVASSNPGFWLPDEQAGGRWYKRSDGSHPYIFGNTMYSFLTGYKHDGPSGRDIAGDVRGNSEYFKKIRFSIASCRYPHPTEKPFLDDKGKPTDDGNYSHRPNPAWFSKRVDLAVRTALEHDLIADLIINGPDTIDARSILTAKANNGDCTPLLKYIAARYGSFPNVWICMGNEFDIKTPKYTPADIVRFGTTIRKFLPYPTPLSVHARPRNWYTELNAKPWHDHTTLQKKIKKLPQAADFIAVNYSIGGFKPVIDDELAYEGKGDGWSEADVIESHLGAFVGGGYGTTGHKPASKQGHYFWGNFKAHEHRAADNLKWLREVIDKNITFWKMAPVANAGENKTKAAIFTNLHKSFRAMGWPENEYVLATNKSHKNIKANLPPGKWQITRYDVIGKEAECLSKTATGTFIFNAGASRAVLFHFLKAI